MRILGIDYGDKKIGLTLRQLQKSSMVILYDDKDTRKKDRVS